MNFIGNPLLMFLQRKWVFKYCPTYNLNIFLYTTFYVILSRSLKLTDYYYSNVSSLENDISLIFESPLNFFFFFLPRSGLSRLWFNFFKVSFFLVIYWIYPVTDLAVIFLISITLPVQIHTVSRKGNVRIMEAWSAALYTNTRSNYKSKGFKLLLKVSADFSLSVAQD